MEDWTRTSGPGLCAQVLHRCTSGAGGSRDGRGCRVDPVVGTQGVKAGWAVGVYVQGSVSPSS